MEQLDDHLDGKIENATKDDIVDYILSWSTATESTIATRKSILKKYFTWTGGVEIVKNLKIKMPRSKLRPEDILTPEDVDKLIDATPSHFYKCIIAVLWETGCRIGEARTLKIKDLRETDSGLIVSIPTLKNDFPCRNMVLLYSAQYVRNYLAYSGKIGDDIIFDVERSTIHIMLQKIKKNAGIAKPVSPHKFRHARATQMVKQGYQEAIIRKMMGWTPTSPMIANYQHLCDSDVINAQIAMNGEVAEKQNV